ncbi:hypothetical protein H7H37_08285 [Mycolicibacterium insubricum]|nr:hypothetical protein [Mycolicibacterium insubricum]
MNSPALLPTPEASPAWLRPLVENATEIRGAYRNRVPRSVLAAITAASAAAALTGDKRDAAVLVLFSGSPDGFIAARRRPRRRLRGRVELAGQDLSNATV